MTSSMPVVANVLEMPKPRKRQVRSRLSYMDDSQIAQFLRTAKEYGAREYAMFLTGLAHGMRASEIANLKIGDINFKSEQIAIHRLKGSLDTVQSLLKVKGDSLFDEARALRAWLAVRKADSMDYVFNSQKSCRLSRVTVYKLFREIACTAGLPESLCHPHVLKHSLGMKLCRDGANAFIVKQALGHRSFDSTLQYIHVSDVDSSSAIARAFAS